MTVPAIIFWAELILLAHEAGHVLAWAAMGVQPAGIAYRHWHHVPLKIGVRFDADIGALTAGQLRRGALAGPAANLLLALGLLPAGHPVAGICSILFGLSQLLPFRGLDGGAAIRGAR